MVPDVEELVNTVRNNLLEEQTKDLILYYGDTSALFTLPTVNDFNYSIGSGSQSFAVSSYINQTCAVSYTMNNSYQVIPSFPSSVSFDGYLTFTVDSVNNSDAGVYQITFVQQLSPNGPSANQTFSLNMIGDPCLSATLTPHDIANFTYYIQQPSSSINIIDTTSSDPSCGNFTYEITDDQGDPLNSSIFTYDSTIKQLNYQTTDQTLNGTQITIVIKSHQGTYSSHYAMDTFTITFIYDICALATITSNPISNVIYKLYGAAIVITIQNWTESVGSCGPFSYFLLTSSAINSFYTFNNSDNTINIYSNDTTTVGEYKFKVYGYFLNVVNKTSFYVIIEDEQCANATLTPFKHSNAIYYIGTLHRSTLIQSSSTSDPSCGNFTYEFSDDSGNPLNPSIFTYDPVNKYLVYNTSDQALLGIYTIVVKSYQGNMSIHYAIDKFNVTLQYDKCAITTIKSASISNQTYILSDDPLIVPIGNWTESDPSCGTFTFKFVYNNLHTTSNSFLTVDNINYKLIIYTNDTLDIGEHSIILVGFTSINYGFIYFWITITNNTNKGGPLFTEGLISKINLTVPEVYKYTFPQIQDIDGDDYSIVLSFDNVSAAALISYQLDRITVTALKYYEGDYTMMIKLTDNQTKPLSQTYKISITINPNPVTVTNTTNNQTSYILPDSNQSNTTVNNSGGSNQGSQLDRPPKIDKAKVKNTLKAKINDISMLGQVEIKFSEKMFELTKFDVIYDTKGLVLKYEPFDSTIKNSITNWTITSFQSYYLRIQLEFDNPLKVSQQVDYDTLRIVFNDTTLFLKESLDEILKDNYEITGSIPPQMPSNGATQALKNLGASASSTLSATVIINIVLAVALGVSLKNLWLLMNTLQILVHLPLLGMSLPSNIVFICQLLKDVSNMNLIPKEWINSLASVFSSGSDNDDDDSEVKDGKFKNMDIFKEDTNLLFQ